jgi:hypothetical protein
MVMEIPLAGKNLIVARKLFVLTLAGRYFRLGGDLRKVMSDADDWQAVFDILRPDYPHF